MNTQDIQVTLDLIVTSTEALASFFKYLQDFNEKGIIIKNADELMELAKEVDSLKKFPEKNKE